MDSPPHITLSGSSEEAQHEALLWLRQRLSESTNGMSVCNNFILHLGEKEQKQLRRMASHGLSVEESFDSGQARITVRGSSLEDEAMAALQVEAMVCSAVDEFVRQEKCRRQRQPGELGLQRKDISKSDPEYLEVEKAVRQMGQQTVKVE